MHEAREVDSCNTFSRHCFSEVPDHRPEEMFLVVGHVVPVVMLLPLPASPLQFLSMFCRFGRTEKLAREIKGEITKANKEVGNGSRGARGPFDMIFYFLT